MNEVSERDFRRNYSCLAIEMIAFGIGMAFLGPATILPSLVRLLGGSPLAVGMLGVIQMGGWILPQLFVGRYVANRPLVKQYVLWPGVISRACLALCLPALALFGVRAPRLALVAFLVALASFIVTDAMGGIGWFDLLAKTIPIDRRSRALGVVQSISSLAAIGVGMVVRAVLARPDPFPRNYVLLISLAIGFYSLCPFAIGFIREPRGAIHGDPQPPWREYLPRLARILRRDPRFAWLTLTGWVAGLAEMGGAFYVLYAAERLRLPQSVLGLLISSSMVGGLLTGAILGPLGDRKGSGAVIAVTMGLRCLCPALALLAPLVAGLHAWAAPGVFMLIFAGLGMIGGAFMISFSNYLLAIAPAGERSFYVALWHTLGIVVAPAPLLAGAIVEGASYEVLFAVCLGLALAGLAASLRDPARAAGRTAGETVSP